MTELRLDGEHVPLAQEDARRLGQILRGFHAGAPPSLAHLQSALDGAVAGIRLDRFEQRELYEALYAATAGGDELSEGLASLRAGLFARLSESAEARISDVTAATFERDVVERSLRLPVVVLLWAPWCGPSCRVLAPVLEREVATRAGRVALARIDVDAAPELAERLGAHTLPAIRAFGEGVVVAELDGPQPPKAIARLLETLTAAPA